MKGIIFTEFLEMVEKDYGMDIVEKIILDSDLDSKGIYTAVGTYHSNEMLELIKSSSLATGLKKEVLLEKFGRYLFHSLHKNYPHFFTKSDLFDFLASVHNYIHVEVLKLYPNAELPSLEVKKREKGELHLLYESERKLGSLAKGLLLSSIEFYNGSFTISEKKLESSGKKILFILKRR
jgi:hypothetical protein